MDEFQEGSRELEHELETQLEQAEMKNKDLKALTNRLQLENEQLRDKLEQCSRDYHFQVFLDILLVATLYQTFHQINELETELAEIKDKVARITADFKKRIASEK